MTSLQSYTGGQRSEDFFPFENMSSNEEPESISSRLGFFPFLIREETGLSDFDLFSDTKIGNTNSINLTVEQTLNYLKSNNTLIPEPSEITDYLITYQEIIYVTEQIAEMAIKYFRQDSQISLELFRDPESDDTYLTIYIRQERYSDNLLDLIDEINGSAEPLLTGISGWIIVNTDFQPPLKNDGF